MCVKRDSEHTQQNTTGQDLQLDPGLVDSFVELEMNLTWPDLPKRVGRHDFVIQPRQVVHIIGAVQIANANIDAQLGYLHTDVVLVHIAHSIKEDIHVNITSLLGPGCARHRCPLARLRNGAALPVGCGDLARRVLWRRLLRQHGSVKRRWCWATLHA